LIADDLLKIIWLSMYHGCSNLNIGYSRVNGFGKETSKSIKSSMIHLSQKFTHLEVMRTVWNFKRFDVPIIKIQLSYWYEDDQKHFDLQGWKDIQIQSLLLIMLLKIKEYKETWNQASGVQVRGGLLGYKRSMYFCLSKYCC
jgi:hypothetical protein